MYHEAQFFGDFIKTYGHHGIAKYHQGKLDTLSTSYINACFDIYKNAARNPLKSLVVGRLVQKDGSGKPVNLDQIVRGLDDLERSNFFTTSETSAGSVLSSNAWTPAMNDSWLMGGIHAGVPFYLASPRTEANVVNPAYGATVMGRELLGLVTFGYTLNANKTLGEVYECSDRSKAQNATFVAYASAFEAAKAGDGFKKLVG